MKNGKGFRKGRGTREAIGLIRMPGEMYNERGREQFLCFIYTENAFDRLLMHCRRLLKKRVDWKNKAYQRTLICIKQKATTKITE